MPWSKLVDMQYSAEEKAEMEMPIPMDRPNYPCGLKIALTDKELTKLGLDAGCEIGDMLDFRAFGIVTSISKDDNCCRVELQLEHLAVESEMEEDEGMPGDEEAGEPTPRRKALYG